MINQVDEKVLIPHSGHDDWLDPAEVRTLTPELILDRLRALKPMIAKNAVEAERLRHPVDEVWSAIRKTGVYYLYVPKKYGGMEYSGLDVYIDAVGMIAEDCASTSWCVGFSIYHQWFIAQMSERFQAEIWGQLPYVTSAGSGFPPGRATMVDGGMRISGRWKWASGIMHSEWVNTMVLHDAGNGQIVPYYVYLPIEQVTVLDTWKTDGMCGTGSHDYVIDDVFIPEHRAVDFRKMALGQLHHENPFYRMPLAPALALVSAASVMGAARGAVDSFASKLSGGGEGYRDQAITRGAVKPLEKPMAQLALGKAKMEVSIAELVIRTASAELEVLGGGDAHMSVEDRIRIRTMYAYAADLCRTALRGLNDASGSTAHFISNPIQRALRDVTVLNTHKIFDFYEAMELEGRILSGLPSNNDWFQPAQAEVQEAAASRKSEETSRRQEVLSKDFSRVN